MDANLLTAYVLIWPAMVLISLLVMSAAVMRDIAVAKKTGEPLV